MENSSEKCVSIIIPVYNVEKYLRECLESVISQTYSNIEIIIVNDGSIDNSIVICENFQKQDKRIKILSQQNAGVSAARNKGLSAASGEYIVFVDADDVVSEYYIKSLVDGIEENGVSMALLSYSSDRECLNTWDSTQKDVIKYQASILFDSMLSLQGADKRVCDGYLWNKIFVTDIIKKNEIQFPCGIEIWEDMYFVLKYLQCIEDCVYLNKILYFYRQREDSAVNRMTIKKLKSKVIVSKMFMELGGSEKFNNCAEKLYYDTIVDYCFRSIFEEDSDCKTPVWIKEVNDKQIRKKYRIKRKIKLWIVKLYSLIK